MKKIITELPEALFEAAQRPEAKAKPYDLCIECSYRKDSCDGPQCLAMEYERWVEWINILAKRQGYTRAVIAEKANLSLATVNSVLSGKSKDVKMYTAAAITRAVKGGTWAQYPCHFVAQMMQSKIIEYDEIDLKIAKNQIVTLEASLSEAKDEAQRKISFLREQITFKEKTILDSRSILISKDKTIKTLGILVGVLAFALLALIIADAFLPQLGWFRY